MALQKPQKSKAPAYVQPVGGHHSQKTTHDSCCIPEKSVPANTSWTGKDGASGLAPTHHIVNPTAH